MAILEYCLGKLGYIKKTTQSKTAANTADPLIADATDDQHVENIDDNHGYIYKNRTTLSNKKVMAGASCNLSVEENAASPFKRLIDRLLGKLGYIEKSTQLQEVVIGYIEKSTQLKEVVNTTHTLPAGTTDVQRVENIHDQLGCTSKTTPSQTTVITGATGVWGVENIHDKLRYINETTQSKTAVNFIQPSSRCINETTQSKTAVNFRQPSSRCINETTQSKTAVNFRQPSMGDHYIKKAVNFRQPSMEDHYVEDVLDKLRCIDRITQSKKPGLEKFLQAVRDELQVMDCPIMSGCVLSYTGSSYESTAVRKGTDYDIILILPRPSRGDYLEVLNSRVPGYYKLKWILNEYHNYGQQAYGKYDLYDCYDTAGSYNVDWLNFVNDENMLETRMLLQYVFDRLGDVLKNVRASHRHWQVSYRVQFSTLVSFFNNENGDKIKVDIVPQIGYRNWEDLPGLCNVRKLPSPLQNCVKESGLQYPILFTLVPAPFMQRNDDGNYLVTTSFAMLEKCCMKASETVKDAVLLVKLVSQSRGWKKNFGLRPFHMKRVAIKHYDELDRLSSWNAFKRLLSYLSSDLHQGKIDGFFIKNQDVYQKRKAVCTQLAVQMDIAMTEVQPSNLKNCLFNTM